MKQVRLILALLCCVPILAGASALAGMQTANAPFPTVTIFDRSDPDRWRLTYGTLPSGLAPQRNAQLLEAGDNAWFAHGNWVRLIDRRRGVVLGRWHVPGRITAISLGDNADSLEVQTEERWVTVIRSTWTVVKGQPALPFYLSWDGEVDVSACEARFSPQPPSGAYSRICRPRTERVDAALARAEIARLEATIERDPFSPWLQVVRGKLLRDAGESQWKDVIRGALLAPTADFIELFAISDFLELLGQPDLAAEAFDRGYRNYYLAGNDPRLVWNSVRFVYAPGTRPLNSEQTWERIYRLAPYARASEIEWLLRALSFDRAGNTAKAQTWHARAGDVARDSRYILTGGISFLADQSVFLLLACVLAGVLYLATLYLRRVPEIPEGGFDDGRLLPLICTSRSERLSLLSIALLAWLAAGALVVMMGGIRPTWFAPASTGSFAWAPLRQFLEQNFAASAERTFALALSHDQRGETDMAERLYRESPEMPESWNNLGVLLLQSGRREEARAAFERAARMDPKLMEAALNLGHGALTPWAAMYRDHFPDRPMRAAPTRRTLIRMFFGSPRSIAARVMMGPFAALLVRDAWRWLPATQRTRTTINILMGAAIALPLIALLVFLLPLEAPRCGPPRAFGYWEALLPGTYPACGLFGGLVLAGWLFLLATPLTALLNGVPSLVYSETTYTLAAYPKRGELIPFLYPEVRRMAVGAIALFLLNGWLVWRNYRAKKACAAVA